MSFDEKVEVDLGEERKPTAQELVETTKTNVQTDFVEPNPAFLLLLVGSLIFVGGMLAAFAIQNQSNETIVPDLNVLTDDVNVTQEHLALVSNQNLILNSLIALQVQHLCGINLLVQDSNQLIENEQGAFVTYSCYAQVDG